MKWVFLLGLLVFTPLLTAYLAKNPKQLPKAAFVLGLLPFIETGYNVSASPIAWPAWPGMTRGVELSLTDSVAIAMLIAGSKFRSPMRLRIAFGAYATAIILSWLLSGNRMASFFYLWQVLRAVVVYFAVARCCARSSQVPPALLSGLMVGLCIQAVVASYQFATGQPHAGGWFGHQNLLGMVSHFIVYPAFAVFLGGYHKKLAAAAVGAGLIIAYAGSSRATIGLLVVGLILTALVSNWHRSNGRKLAFAGAALLGVALMSPILYMAVERRSAEQRTSSNKDRENMIAAARMIVADHPLGIGVNTYVMVANLGGYSARSGTGWQTGAAPVHNSYYLVLAEMSLFGLMAFIGMLAAALSTAIRALRRTPPSFAGEYASGIAVSIMAVASHAYVEWITMIYQVHILFAMSVGLVASLLYRASSAEALPRTNNNRTPRPAFASDANLAT